MARMGLRESLAWIARNDDTEWLDDDHYNPSVTFLMVIDIFGADENRALATLRRLVRERARRLGR